MTIDSVDPAKAENNRIYLCGVFAGEALIRVLPSGDELVSFRVTVARPPGDRVRVDSIDCASTKAAVRRAAVRCRPGETIELAGSLHRRFWRSAGGSPASRYEVEVSSITRSRAGRRSAIAAADLVTEPADKKPRRRLGSKKS
jgi:single-strand DNA-binding protein